MPDSVPFPNPFQLLVHSEPSPPPNTPVQIEEGDFAFTLSERDLAANLEVVNQVLQRDKMSQDHILEQEMAREKMIQEAKTHLPITRRKSEPHEPQPRNTKSIQHTNQ